MNLLPLTNSVLVTWYMGQSEHSVPYSALPIVLLLLAGSTCRLDHVGDPAC